LPCVPATTYRGYDVDFAFYGISGIELVTYIVFLSRIEEGK